MLHLVIMKKIEIEIHKEVENKKISGCPNFAFVLKLFMSFFSKNDFFAQIKFSCSL